MGALCSRRAAELYGLEVLEEGVQDVKDNITRFLVLSRWGWAWVWLWGRRFSGALTAGGLGGHHRMCIGTWGVKP